LTYIYLSRFLPRVLPSPIVTGFFGTTTHLTSLALILSTLACTLAVVIPSLRGSAGISRVNLLIFVTCHALGPRGDLSFYLIESVVLPSEFMTPSALPTFPRFRGSIALPFRITACSFSILRLIHVVASMYPKIRYGMGGIPFPAELSSAN
jgi:hypothetical protein